MAPHRPSPLCPSSRQLLQKKTFGSNLRSASTDRHMRCPRTPRMARIRKRGSISARSANASSARSRKLRRDGCQRGHRYEKCRELASACPCPVLLQYARCHRHRGEVNSQGFQVSVKLHLRGCSSGKGLAPPQRLASGFVFLPPPKVSRQGRAMAAPITGAFEENAKEDRCDSETSSVDWTPKLCIPKY